MTTKLTPTERLVIREVTDLGPRTAGELIDLTEANISYAVRIISKLVASGRIAQDASRRYYIPAATPLPATTI